MQAVNGDGGMVAERQNLMPAQGFNLPGDAGGDLRVTLAQILFAGSTMKS